MADGKKVIKNSLFDYAGIKCHSYQISDCHDMRAISISELHRGVVKCLKKALKYAVEKKS